MPEQQISIKKLGEFKNSNITFVIGYVEDDGTYVAVALQGFNRIALRGHKNEMEYFLQSALDGVRRGQDN